MTETGLFRKEKLMHGKIEYSDGFVYEGCFDNRLKAGKGRLTFANGDIYTGYFVAGEM